MLIGSWLGPLYRSRISALILSRAVTERPLSSPFSVSFIFFVTGSVRVSIFTIIIISLPGMTLLLLLFVETVQAFFSHAVRIFYICRGISAFFYRFWRNNSFPVHRDDFLYPFYRNLDKNTLPFFIRTIRRHLTEDIRFLMVKQTLSRI